MNIKLLVLAVIFALLGVAGAGPVYYKKLQFRSPYRRRSYAVTRPRSNGRRFGGCDNLGLVTVCS